MIAMLPPERIDDVARALLTLTQEVWVLADRVHVMEALLERDGAITSDSINRFVPDEAFIADNLGRRAARTKGVFAALGVPQS